jgi:sugar lactone lactonase YvrE
MNSFVRGWVWVASLVIGINLSLNVVRAAAPPNDDFDSATVISSLPFDAVLVDPEATPEADDPAVCFGGGYSMWYAFTPGSTVDVAANTFGATFNANTLYLELSVWTGARGALNFAGVDCTQRGLTFTAFAGTTYYFMVKSPIHPASGPISIPFHVAEAQFRPAKQVIGQPVPWSSGCNSTGLNAASLCSPSEVLVASGALYVADRGNHRVLAYDSPLTTDVAADHVFGQMGGFATGTCNLGGISENSICQPNGLAMDASGNLFVSETNNNRVLEFDSPLATDMAADMVFGQPDFTTATCNTGGLGAGSLCAPRGLSIDAAGSLYVSDGFTGNSRVLVYENPLSDAVADEVIGQPDFTTAGCNTGGIGAGSVCFPSGTAFDAAGNLYLADQANNRVLIYFNPLLDDDVADMVIGQPGFFTADFPLPTASSLNQPIDVALDSAGNLYVSDIINNRVLVYRTPLSTDAVADLVYGQPDFTNGAANFTSESSLWQPRGIALDVNDNPYVADLGNSRVLVYDTDPDFDGLFGSFDACPHEVPEQGLDADHNGCTDTIAGLKTIVQNLSINSTLKNGLLGKLDEAQKALNRGNKQVAVNKLLSFISQVEGAKNNHQITDVDAALLLAYANNLISLIGGNA